MSTEPDTNAEPQAEPPPPAGEPRHSDALSRREGAQLSTLRKAARSTGNAVNVVAHEVRNAPARGWLLAERVTALAARAGDARVAMSDVIGALWELAENSEANVLHVVNGPLGPEKTNMKVSPKALRAQAANAGRADWSDTHEDPDARAADEGPVVRMQTGGMLSSDEAVMVELEVPERHLEAVIARLEAAGLATEELGRQLRGLTSHALPLRSGRRR